MAGINHVAVKTSGEKGLASEWNADHEQKGNHDCAKFQHLNHVIENRTTMPAGPVEGQVIYRSDQHTFYHWNGTRWVSLVGPATVVVAADGSGDTTDIQEGIDQLPATGGVVYIKEGTYTLTVGLTITSNNVALIGAGRATIIQTLIDILILDIDGADYYHIENIYFKGFFAGNNNNVQMIDCNNGRIINCWSEDAGHIGILIGGTSTSNYVAGCFCLNNKDDGLSVFGDDTIVDGNVCIGNGGAGIEVNDDRNIISNNICNTNVGNGIDSDVDDGIIIGNVCVGNDSGNTASWSGIIIKQDRCVVTNNRCQDNDNYEITIHANADRTVVVGNNCYGTDRVGAIEDNGTNTQLAHNIT